VGGDTKNSENVLFFNSPCSTITLDNKDGQPFSNKTIFMKKKNINGKPSEHAVAPWSQFLAGKIRVRDP
jgi:hypothetical protein